MIEFSARFSEVIRNKFFIFGFLGAWMVALGNYGEVVGARQIPTFLLMFCFFMLYGFQPYAPGTLIFKKRWFGATIVAVVVALVSYSEMASLEAAARLSEGYWKYGGGATYEIPAWLSILMVTGSAIFLTSIIYDIYSHALTKRIGTHNAGHVLTYIALVIMVIVSALAWYVTLGVLIGCSLHSCGMEGLAIVIAAPIAIVASIISWTIVKKIRKLKAVTSAVPIYTTPSTPPQL